jgi:aminodeoxyfutalosine synthase
MMSINQIADSLRRGERLSTIDAIKLWREAPLWLLGELAVERKRQASGDEVYYNRNIHLEPSNICLFNCEFCSFRRREGDPDAWTMSLDDVEARAREMQGSDITEVHIVGGVHPKHDLETYCAMIRRVKGALPNVAIKAYTAVEILYMIRRAGISIVEGLRRLKEAGMEAIPGGGAEIFDEELRAKICPDKCSSEEWLAVHRAAHNMDIPTNCTMLYGHIETIEQRVDHLDRLRRLQDEAPGFDAFIPLKYRSRNNRMSEIGECSVEEDMRMIAMSRIFLDNIPHIKAYWVAYGKPTTEMALAFGADDIDGTIDDSTKIYSMAGADEKPSMSVAELEDLVRGAGFVPIERDTHYNAVVREKRVVEAPKAEPTPVVVAPEPKPEVKVEPKVESKPEVKVEQPTKETNKKEKKSMAKTKAKAKEGVKSFYERHHIISHIILIGIVGIALIIALYIGLKIGTRHGNTIAVPNYLGMSVDDVRAHAKREGLEIVVRDSVFDSDVAGGVVVDQLPKLSTKRTVTVKPGRKIYVTINAYNRRMVDVPYVAKQTLRQALNQLERAGLSIEKLNYEPNLTSTDYVVRQSIEGREISPSTAVKVPYATGVTLGVTYRRDEQYTVVPRLVGMRLSQAKSTVWDRGLNIKEVIYDATVTDFKQRREAKVYKQSLHPNAGAQRGSELTLYLSCDMELVDSLTKISDRDARAYEKKRREEEAEREAQLAKEEAETSEE